MLPGDKRQVASIVRLCARYVVPLVARGAGTGLSGGALPHARGILLNLARLNRILEIDAGNRCARVEAGVRNLAISEAAAPFELFYAPDPSSQLACTIGGNIAENSGGVHCLKYGLTVHNIMALEVVTAAGEFLQIGTKAVDAPGYDMLALLTGSEGMLGVVTEATVRLLPKPACAQVLLAAFDSVESAGAAVAGVIASGIVPAGLEMMDAAATRAAEAYVAAGYPVDAAAILLCELDGNQAEVTDQSDRVCAIFNKFGASSVRRATDAAECAKLWAGRKAAFPAVGRLAPDYYCMDGTIPRKEIAAVLKEIAALSQKFGRPVVNVFHAGDGNLHPLILYDANQPDQLRATEQLGSEILQLCVRVGGTITGEHGVGVEKLNEMCVQFSTAELDRFHALKRAFDPQGLLNPGKAVPSLHRCAEFGAMHVHAGNLPHPELPRF